MTSDSSPASPRQLVVAVAEEGEVVVLEPDEERARLGDLVGVERRRVGPQLGRPASSARARISRPVVDRGAHLVDHALEVALELLAARPGRSGARPRRGSPTRPACRSASAPCGSTSSSSPVGVAAHLDDRVDDQVDAEAAPVELHADRVDQERHVVGHDLDGRVRRLPAVRLELGVVDADLGRARRAPRGRGRSGRARRRRGRARAARRCPRARPSGSTGARTPPPGPRRLRSDAARRREQTVSISVSSTSRACATVSRRVYAQAAAAALPDVGLDHLGDLIARARGRPQLPRCARPASCRAEPRCRPRPACAGRRPRAGCTRGRASGRRCRSSRPRSARRSGGRGGSRPDGLEPAAASGGARSAGAARARSSSRVASRARGSPRRTLGRERQRMRIRRRRCFAGRGWLGLASRGSYDRPPSRRSRTGWRSSCRRAFRRSGAGGASVRDSLPERVMKCEVLSHNVSRL